MAFHGTKWTKHLGKGQKSRHGVGNKTKPLKLELYPIKSNMLIYVNIFCTVKHAMIFHYSLKHLLSESLAARQSLWNRWVGHDTSRRGLGSSTSSWRLCCLVSCHMVSRWGPQDAFQIRRAMAAHPWEINLGKDYDRQTMGKSRNRQPHKSRSI